MFFKTTSLNKEIYKWRIFETTYARRLADTKKTRILNLLPRPPEMEIENLLPDWNMLPIHSPLPLPLMAPPGTIAFTRGTLGENILRLCNTFDLGDPYGRDFKIEYESIHDRHLRHYLMAPHIRKHIESSGVITSDNKVNCDLKTYNAYRHYLWTAHRSGLKTELLKLETQELTKQRFVQFLKLATRRMKQHEQLGYVGDLMLQRKIALVIKKLFSDVLKDYRTDVSKTATNRLTQVKNDEWIIHLVKERDYPTKRRTYLLRSFNARAHKGVHFVIKWRNQFVWEDEVVKIKERCRELKQMLCRLRWQKKINDQIIFLKRDFIIQNDFLVHTEKRKRIREKQWEMDRLAMKEKFNRIRHYRDYSLIEKKIKRQKYSNAAKFLVNYLQHPPLRSKGWEIIDESEGFRQRMIRVTKRPNLSWSLKPKIVAKKRVGRITHANLLKGRLAVSRLGWLIAEESLFHFAQRFAYKKVITYCSVQLATCRKYLKCIISRLRHRKTVPKPSVEVFEKRYSWTGKLPFKVVAENMPPEEVTRRKLEFAVRRFMKHERRRHRMIRDRPEWAYYNKYSSKYKNEPLLIPAKWKELDLYFPLISEQFHFPDWNRRCKSFGKYLLYTLINTPSYDGKKRKINGSLTRLKASILKLKNKVRIIVDIMKRIIGKKLRLQYPKSIKDNLGIMRSHVRRILPKDLKSGDGYITGIAFMVTTMNLYQLNLQYLGPFAEVLLLHICFPRRFPMHFKKYRIDKYHKRRLFETIYSYKGHPFPGAKYKQKIEQIEKLRKLYQKDPEFMLKVLEPTPKYACVYRNKAAGKFIEYK